MKHFFSSFFSRFSHFSLFSRKPALSLLLFSCVVLSGCQNIKETSSELSSAPPSENKLSVVTSFYPLAFFAQEIAGNTADVINLSGGKSPHSYTISPHDRVKLSHADIVIYQGIGLETWTTDSIPTLQADGVTVLEASRGLSLNKNEHDNHDEHQTEGFDPHIWIDPIVAQKIAENIAQILIEKKPQNSQIYRQNLTILTEKLKNLDAQYQSQLKNCVQKKAFISHDAFGYLEKRYNFELFPIAGMSPSDTPSAKLIAELQNIAKTQAITHILTEENMVKKYATLLSKESGIQMLSINPMGTKPNTGDYFSTAKNNLQSLSTAFQCQ